MSDKIEVNHGEFEKLQTELLEALQKNVHIMVYGPSKSGKTYLVDSVKEHIGENYERLYGKESFSHLLADDNKRFLLETTFEDVDATKFKNVPYKSIVIEPSQIIPMYLPNGSKVERLPL